MGLFGRRNDPVSTECDAQCGTPVDLSKKHVTVSRTVERERRGKVTVSDAEVVEQYHEDCAPKRGRS